MKTTENTTTAKETIQGALERVQAIAERDETTTDFVRYREQQTANYGDSWHMDAIKEANALAGHYWFSPNTVKATKSRTHGDAIKGKGGLYFFVQSTANIDGTGREFRVAQFDTKNGHISYADDGAGSKRGAVSHARRFASGEELTRQERRRYAEHMEEQFILNGCTVFITETRQRNQETHAVKVYRPEVLTENGLTRRVEMIDITSTTAKLIGHDCKNTPQGNAILCNPGYNRADFIAEELSKAIMKETFRPIEITGRKIGD